MNCSFDMLTTFSLGPLQYRWGVCFFSEVMTFISAAFSIDAVDFLLYIDCYFSFGVFEPHTTDRWTSLRCRCLSLSEWFPRHIQWMMRFFALEGFTVSLSTLSNEHLFEGGFPCVTAVMIAFSMASERLEAFRVAFEAREACTDTRLLPLIHTYRRMKQ
jgi:hypothetical protein